MSRRRFPRLAPVARSNQILRMSEQTEAPASTCVLCDRAVPRVQLPAGPTVGFCPTCAADLNLLPVEDLSRLSQEEIDRLPFGHIALDPEGTVLRFNAHEARKSGLDPRNVVGRSFFREVAPCTSVQAFAGRYEQMVRGECSTAQRFRYVFRFRGSERLVQIFLSYLPARGEGLIIVRELSHV